MLFQSRSQICKDSSSGHNHNYSNRKNVFIEQRGGVSRHQAQEPGQRARRHRGEGEARAQHRGQGGHGQGGGRGARPGGGVEMAEDVGWDSIKHRDHCHNHYHYQVQQNCFYLHQFPRLRGCRSCGKEGGGRAEAESYSGVGAETCGYQT